MVKNKRRAPLFSLIIAIAPWRNAEILYSLEKMDYPRDKYEIIIQKGSNASKNRNIGAAKAKGDILAFLDDDAIVHPSLLKNAEQFFMQHPAIDIAGGPQLTPENDLRFAKISGYALESIFGSWKISKRYFPSKMRLNVDETMLTSANLFCRKHVFMKVNFREDLWPGEDPAFIEDSKKEGFIVAYNPELIVYHRRRSNIKDLSKQVLSYGISRPKFESFFKTLKKPYFLAPGIYLIYLFIIIFMFSPLFIYYNLYEKIGVIAFLIYLPLILYIILMIISTLLITIKYRDIHILYYLPVIYIAIHSSYGIGIIAGYLKNIFNDNQK